MMRNAGRILLAAVLLAACDDPTGNVRPDPDRRDGRNARQTTDELAERRVGVDIRAAGAFRPNTPITVTAASQARYGSDVSFDLVLLDEDPSAGAEVTQRGRPVGSFRGVMGRGEQRQLVASVTFPRAGYYRVLARAVGNPAGDVGQMAGDTILIEQSVEVLHLLVTEQGGRATTTYDSAAIPAGRVPMYGSFGPFVEGRTRGARGAASASISPVGGEPRSNVQRGVFRFYNEDVLDYRPVPNAQVNVTCLDASFNPASTFVIATATDGSFSISCPTGYYDAAILLRNRLADVMNTDRSSAGVTYFNESVGAYPTLNANNNAAAYIHTVLNQYVPVAEQRFGLSRTRVPVTVNMQDTSLAHYDQVNDTIRTNYKRATGIYGRYVTMHEYGHAFHWRAIEAPATFYCNEENVHYPDLQSNSNCAFVEGFAEFFATWLLEAVLTDQPYADYQMENQIHYSGKDGVQVEGAVAGFMYDLVDGTGSPNGRANETGDEDWWGDGATYPASFLANVMRSCTLTTGTNTWTNLWGADDLVYCLENSTTAAAEASRLGYNSWYRYDAVARNVTAPTGVTFDMTRRLWKRNFYGVTQ